MSHVVDLSFVLPVSLLVPWKIGNTEQLIQPERSGEVSADQGGPQGRCEGGRVGGRQDHALPRVAEPVEHQCSQKGTHG